MSGFSNRREISLPSLRQSGQVLPLPLGFPQNTELFEDVFTITPADKFFVVTNPRRFHSFSFVHVRGAIESIPQT